MIWKFPEELKPKIFVPVSVMEQMEKEVLDHPTSETAWDLYGKYDRKTCSILINGIIRPLPENVSRRIATTQVGSDWQGAAIRWLEGDYQNILKNLTPEMRERYKIDDVWFGFLFRGHSHHQLGINGYSGTDIRSMQDAIIKDGLPVAVGPLANIRLSGPRFMQKKSLVNSYQVISRAPFEVIWKFYFLSQEMVQANWRQPIEVPFQLLKDNTDLLEPSLAWQFANPDRFGQEIQMLTSYGVNVMVFHRPRAGSPDLYVQFMLRHEYFNGQILNIWTKFNYPNTMPEIEIVNLGQVRGVNNEILNREWTPKMTLTEVIWTLYNQGEFECNSFE